MLHSFVLSVVTVPNLFLSFSFSLISYHTFSNDNVRIKNKVGLNHLNPLTFVISNNIKLMKLLVSSQSELPAKIYWNSDSYFLHKSTIFSESVSFSLVYFVKIFTSCLHFIPKFLISAITFIPGAIMLRCQGRISVGLYVTYTVLNKQLLYLNIYYVQHLDVMVTILPY